MEFIRLCFNIIMYFTLNIFVLLRSKITTFRRIYTLIIPILIRSAEGIKAKLVIPNIVSEIR